MLGTEVSNLYAYEASRPDLNFNQGQGSYTEPDTDICQNADIRLQQGTPHSIVPKRSQNQSPGGPKGSLAQGSNSMGRWETLHSAQVPPEL